MRTKLFLAGLVAVGCAAPFSASAQSCPPGQIFRVKIGVCQPKSSDNAQWLKAGDKKPAAALRSAEKPSVGDVVLFGEGAPTLLKPSERKPTAKPAPKSAAKAAPQKPAVAKAAPKKAVATAAPQPVVPPVPAQAPREQEAVTVPPVEDAGAMDASPVAAASAPAAEPPRVEPPQVSQSAPVEPAEQAAPTAAAPADLSSDQTGSIAIARDESQAGDDAPVKPRAEEEIAALGLDAGAARAPPPQEPSSQAVIEPPARAMESVAAVAPPKQARTVPLRQEEAPSPPDAANSGLPDWGDEKLLVETLRADWKSRQVTRTFQRGDAVPTEIPLQPLPPSLASRDAGVNMHYLIANGDAVLVLPGMRVVVDVYHEATASIR